MSTTPEPVDAKKPQPETHSLGFAIGALLVIAGVLLFVNSAFVQGFFGAILGAVIMLVNHFVKFSGR